MYTIKFSDNTILNGGDPKKTNWEKIPEDKEIARIEIQITYPNLVLEGYEEYSLHNELTTFVKIAKGYYTCMTFIGKKGDKCDVLSFHPMSGKIFKRETTYEKAYSVPIVGYNKEEKKWAFKGWTEPRQCVGWVKGKKFNFAPRILKLDPKD